MRNPIPTTVAMRIAIATLLVTTAVAVPAVSARQDTRDVPSGRADSSRGTDDWGRIGRYTEGDRWYSRNLAADLRSMRKCAASLEASLGGGAATRSTERAASGLAKSTQLALRDLRRGDRLADVADSDAPASAVPLAERVSELVSLVDVVSRRIAAESKSHAVDLTSRRETERLLIRIENAAVAIHAEASGGH